MNWFLLNESVDIVGLKDFYHSVMYLEIDLRLDKHGYIQAQQEKESSPYLGVLFISHC